MKVPAGNTTYVAKWTPKSYKVAFNANGKGKMAVQTFAYGKAKKLSANKFKRKGYVFKGWAKSKALAKKGKVTYKNKQKVKNLVTTGKTVKLYAVWGGIPRPSNDNFSNATVIVADYSKYSNEQTYYTIKGSNKDATLQAGEPVHGADRSYGGTKSQASVWYRWKAPLDGDFCLYSPSGSGRRRIDVYKGSSLSSLYKIAGSHEQWGGYAGSFYDTTDTISATAGTTYYIAIASGKSGNGKPGSFSITLYFYSN